MVYVGSGKDACSGVECHMVGIVPSHAGIGGQTQSLEMKSVAIVHCAGRDNHRRFGSVGRVVVAFVSIVGMRDIGSDSINPDLDMECSVVAEVHVECRRESVIYRRASANAGSDGVGASNCGAAVKTIMQHYGSNRRGSIVVDQYRDWLGGGEVAAGINDGIINSKVVDRDIGDTDGDLRAGTFTTVVEITYEVFFNRAYLHGGIRRGNLPEGGGRSG